MASCPSSCRKYLEKMTQLHSETEQMHTEGLKNKFFSDIPDIVGTQLISATWAMCVCLKIKKFKKKKPKQYILRFKIVLLLLNSSLISSFSGTWRWCTEKRDIPPCLMKSTEPSHLRLRSQIQIAFYLFIFKWYCSCLSFYVDKTQWGLLQG